MPSTLITTATIARWLDPSRTTAYSLQADGTLFTSTRLTPGDVWSPLREVGRLAQSIESFESYLNGLTSA